MMGASCFIKFQLEWWWMSLGPVNSLKVNKTTTSRRTSRIVKSNGLFSFNFRRWLSVNHHSSFVAYREKKVFTTSFCSFFLSFSFSTFCPVIKRHQKRVLRVAKLALQAKEESEWVRTVKTSTTTTTSSTKSAATNSTLTLLIFSFFLPSFETARLKKHTLFPPSLFV